MNADCFWFCRFDECGISPLTVKALTAAGYIQMTKVQEAAISVCLEGMMFTSFHASRVLPFVSINVFGGKAMACFTSQH